MAKSTKERIIDAAELLLAAYGMDGTSVRMVAAKAEASLSSLRFHFGSREGIITAVLLRRLVPLAVERGRRLRELQSRAGAAPRAEEVLAVFVEPLFEMSRSRDPGVRAFLKILSRTLIDPSPEYREILATGLAVQYLVFVDAFQAALPYLSREEIAGRMDFAVGAIGHALSDPTRREGAVGPAKISDPERLIPQLIAFLLGGFKASPGLPNAS
jgi:AcrR family transcriptional regulator